MILLWKFYRKNWINTHNHEFKLTSIKFLSLLCNFEIVTSKIVTCTLHCNQLAEPLPFAKIHRAASEANETVHELWQREREREREWERLDSLNHRYPNETYKADIRCVPRKFRVAKRRIDYTVAECYQIGIKSNVNLISKPSDQWH